MQDEIIRWIAAGVVGSIVKDILGLITFWTKLASFHIVFVAADIFMDGPDIYRFKGCFLGFLVDLLIGGILGVVLGVFLKRSGSSHYLLKGIFLCLVFWLFAIGFVMHTLIFVFSIVLTQFNDVLYSLIAHVVFGMAASYLIIRFDPRPIQKS